MKNRFIAVALSLIMLFSSASMLVNADGFMLGDADGNGKITAMDARTVLRAAAKIEPLAEEYLAAADVNFDGKVTAMDARIILRAAAKVEELPEIPTDEPPVPETTTAEPTTQPPETTTKEPDSNTGVVVTEYPEAISAFFNGTFYLNGRVGSDGDIMTIKMATNKSGTEIVMDSGKGILSIYATKSSSYLKVITTDGKKYYVELTKTMMENYGIDFGDALADFSFLSFENIGDPVLTKEEYDGNECDIYTFTTEDDSVIKFYADGEDVLKIAVCAEDGSESTAIFIDELTSEIPKTMLTIKGFKETSILMLPSILPDFAN